jgi:hypothetical protein
MRSKRCALVAATSSGTFSACDLATLVWKKRLAAPLVLDELAPLFSIVTLQGSRLRALRAFFSRSRVLTIFANGTLKACARSEEEAVDLCEREIVMLKRTAGLRETREVPRALSYFWGGCVGHVRLLDRQANSRLDLRACSRILGGWFNSTEKNHAAYALVCHSTVLLYAGGVAIVRAPNRQASEAACRALLELSGRLPTFEVEPRPRSRLTKALARATKSQKRKRANCDLRGTRGA